MNKLYEIPEGYIQVIPFNNEFVLHPKEIKLYDEDELIHYFVFVTDYSNFRVFDRVTGEFKKHRKQTKKKLFESEEE